jgi:hypothetical protein
MWKYVALSAPGLAILTLGCYYLPTWAENRYHEVRQQGYRPQDPVMPREFTPEYVTPLSARGTAQEV